MGNEAMITATDMVDYLIEDQHTQVICLFLEQIGDPSCGQLGQSRVSPPGAAVGRDFGALTPGPIREGKEVFAGRDRSIHSRKIEAPGSRGVATQTLAHVVGSRSARGGHEDSEDRRDNRMVVVHPTETPWGASHFAQLNTGMEKPPIGQLALSGSVNASLIRCVP